jgi:hypothetical protein
MIESLVGPLQPPATRCTEFRGIPAAAAASACQIPPQRNESRMVSSWIMYSYFSLPGA